MKRYPPKGGYNVNQLPPGEEETVDAESSYAPDYGVLLGGLGSLALWLIGIGLGAGLILIVLYILFAMLVCGTIGC